MERKRRQCPHPHEICLEERRLRTLCGSCSETPLVSGVANWCLVFGINCPRVTTLHLFRFFLVFLPPSCSGWCWPGSCSPVTLMHCWNINSNELFSVVLVNTVAAAALHWRFCWGKILATSYVHCLKEKERQFLTIVDDCKIFKCHFQFFMIIFVYALFGQQNGCL